MGYLIISIPVETMFIISLSLLVLGFTLNKIVTKIKGAPLDTWQIIVPILKVFGIFFLIMGLLKF
ncbi:hypothetical protein [Sutcliffiella sp. NC1]|uniref:hypothetical protein n=1 Tax=Sutcliffiella sp. NC1 TaxID=3004096 RepID=UPI0022DE01CE|nr:hypothetical protein [Sutcliffiella sp. NC1]WBL16967.1 hypothetical protein O1A01_10185 [Sutcliffiella sp. NC1]